jgi:integrase
MVQSKQTFFAIVIKDTVAENRELTEVVCTAVASVPGSSAKRQKTAEALPKILEGRIRTKNTSNAYKAAWRCFFGFCLKNKLEFGEVKPYHVVDWLTAHPGSVATKRQHLSAVRVLFDHLLEKGAVESNPAARTKAPRLKRETSHTPVFEEQEIQAFLDSIQLRSLIDVRDKAFHGASLHLGAGFRSGRTRPCNACYLLAGELSSVHD